MLDSFTPLIEAFRPDNPRYKRHEFEIYRCRRDKHYAVEAYTVAWSPTICAETSRGADAPITLSDSSSLHPIFWLTTDGRLVTQSEMRTSTGEHRMIFVGKADRISWRDQDMLRLGLQGNFDQIDRMLQAASREHLLFTVEMLVRQARSYPQAIPAALEEQFDKVLKMQQGPEYESAKVELMDALLA